MVHSRSPGPSAEVSAALAGSSENLERLPEQSAPVVQKTQKRKSKAPKKRVCPRITAPSVTGLGNLHSPQKHRQRGMSWKCSILQIPQTNFRPTRALKHLLLSNARQKLVSLFSKSVLYMLTDSSAPLQSLAGPPQQTVTVKTEQVSNNSSRGSECIHLLFQTGLTRVSRRDIISY